MPLNDSSKAPCLSTISFFTSMPQMQGAAPLPNGYSVNISCGGEYKRFCSAPIYTISFFLLGSFQSYQYSDASHIIATGCCCIKLNRCDNISGSQISSASRKVINEPPAFFIP